MAKITLYEHVNKGGRSLTLYGDDKSLTNNKLSWLKSWNDQVSSVDVESGTWKLWEHVNFKGDAITLTPYTWNPAAKEYGVYNLTGYYHDGESWNDEVSSVDLLYA